MLWLPLALAALAGYLFGSVPAGYLAGRLCGKDLRTEGSGNVGATNALRVLGKGWGYAVFAVDFLKGFLGVKAAIFLAAQTGETQSSLMGVAGAIGAVLGHNFPVWLGFRGGKGISTSAGVMLALFHPIIFLAGLITWVGIFFLTRYVSVASLAAAFSLPVSAWTLFAFGLCDRVLAITAVVMGALAFWRHRPNIVRLLHGTEKRFERTKSPAPPAGGASAQ